MRGNGTASSVVGVTSSIPGTTRGITVQMTLMIVAATPIICHPRSRTAVSPAPRRSAHASITPGSEPPTRLTATARVASVSADPINSNDPAVLRAEILTLRDQLAVAGSGTEVLHDLVSERDRRIAELDARANALAEELARNPIVRAGRAVTRRLGRR